MDRFIGSKLRKAREAIGLSQGAFARAIGLSSEYISLLEADKRTPRFSTLQKHRGVPQPGHRLLLPREGRRGPTPSPCSSGPRPWTTAPAKSSSASAATATTISASRRSPAAGSISPLSTANITPERLADEERRRLGLGDEPVRDIFSLLETNGCRILRMPMPADSKVSGVFIYLEQKEAAFALVNSAQSPGRQAFSAAHEYCHYLKDRLEGPVIDDPDVFIDEVVSLYHPREPFAQAFAARFLMPPSKVREMIEKEFRVRRSAVHSTRSST